MNEILKMEGINKIYGDTVKTQVLYDIDLAFQAGSFNSIIGQSGSGKSTLLNIMGTLDRPTSGTIRIGDEETSKLSAKKLSLLRNDWLGFVFQFHYLLPEFTALENVCIPGFIAGTNKNELIKKAKYLLAALKVEDRAEHKPNELSGGEKQRVAIARALINNPSIILADEPSGNLDSKNAKDLYEIIFGLREEFAQTFVIVTHNMQQAARVSDYTGFFLNGYLVEFNRTSELFVNPFDKKTEDYITGRFG